MVRLVFEKHGKTYTIYKFRKSKVHSNNTYLFEGDISTSDLRTILETNSELIKKPSEVVKEILDLIKIDENSFLQTVYFSQSNDKPFFEKEPEEKYQVFENLLPELENFSNFKEHIKKTLKNLDNDKTQIFTKISTLISNIEQDNETINLTKAENDKQIESLKKNIELNKNTLKELSLIDVEALNEEIELYDKEKNNLLNNKENQVELIEKDKKEFITLKEEKKAEENEITLLKEEIKTMEEINFEELFNTLEEKKDYEKEMQELKLYKASIKEDNDTKLELEKAINKLNTEINELENNIKEKEATLALLESTINKDEEAIENIKTSIKKKTVEIDTKIFELKEEIKTLNNNKCHVCGHLLDETETKTLIAKNENVIKDLLSQKEDYLMKNNEEISNLNIKIKNNKKEANIIKDEVDIFIQKKAEKNETGQKSIETLKTICEEKEEKYKSAVAEVDKQINNLEKKLKKYASLNEEKINLDKNSLEIKKTLLQEKETKFELFLKKYENFKQKMEILIKNLQKTEKKIKNLKKPEKTKSDLDEIKIKISSLKSSNENYEKTISDLQESNLVEKIEIRKKESQKELKKIQAKEKKLLNEIDNFFWWKQNIDTIKKLYIINVVKIFEKRVNILLQYFFTRSIEFFIDENLKTTIIFEGEEHTTTDVFSGGERQRINLATNFGLFLTARLINNETFNFTILDEVLDKNLDNFGVQGILKIIDKLSAEENINCMIVSHKSEYENFFDTKIKIIRNEEGFAEIHKYIA